MSTITITISTARHTWSFGASLMALGLSGLAITALAGLAIG